MFLYGFTLQRATQITLAVHGQFSNTKQQLIAVSRGKILELLRPDPDTGKLTTLLSTEIFGVIRSMLPFRLTGAQKDYLVVGSDSGRICVLEYNPEKNVFERLHMETFGKSGCRRIVPGQYLAADPKGRAIMIGAVEKQKLVYIMNRDSAARLTISSPLEAHKAHTVVTHIASLDVVFENPLFACLEANYEECDEDPTGDAYRQLQQTLTFYELDLGLNHVVRKESIPLEAFGNLLISVPGGSDGPGGVLVCSEDFVTWRTMGEHTPVCVRIPRRRTPLDNGRGTLVTSSAVHKTKTMSFFLLQTEQGDIFKLTIVVQEDKVTNLLLKYFDTVPVANSLCLLRNGMLFVAAEFGTHYLYQVQQLGDNEDEPTYDSISQEVTYFVPRDLLNLAVVDELDSLAPIIDFRVADLVNEEAPQFYCAIGRGGRSTLRTLRHGLEISQMATSELPGTPTAVWTVRRHVADARDSYIVVSFVNATLVLSIGETVEEVTDSGFLATTPTITVGRIGDDALVQVYPEGIRHIRSDRRVNEWKAPGKRTITHAAINERQVAISLSGGEIVYFELDRMGQLNEYQERMEMNAEIMCLGIGTVPEGQQRSRFLAVGLQDATVRLVSLDPADCLQLLSTQALPGRPESLVLQEMGEPGEKQAPLYVFIGVDSGVMLRSLVDNVTGDLSDTRTRYLGVRGVRLFRLSVQGQNAVLALSSRPWLAYNFQGQMRVTPLSYDALDFASMFSSEQCPEGIVAIARHTLRIISVSRLGAIFNQVSSPLTFTPRKMTIDTRTNFIYMIEGDHNAVSTAVLAAAQSGSAGMDVDGAAPPKEYGEPRYGRLRWASNIRIFDPSQNQTIHLVALDPNEIATAIALVPLTRGPADIAHHLVVATVRDFDPQTNAYAMCFLNTYEFVGDDERKPVLQLLHKTPIEYVCSAIVGLHGRVIAGVGRFLRLYEMGKRKLLRKCENKHLPAHVVSLSAIGTRIAVGDLRESIVFVKYKPALNQLCMFADDTNPRWCTSVAWLDYSTVTVVDKFGSISVLRLPADVSDEVDDDPHINRAAWDKGLLNGASQKCEILAQYHIGETALAVQKAALTPGGGDIIVYATMAGALGVLVPFTNKEDIDFFQHLEMFMRSEHPPLLGRDHLSYRSYYFPVKCVVDGDLCESFNALDPRKKRAIADELRRTPAEISKKLEDLRNRYAF
eukprot:m.27271 g.27271  ORF g.27271 m.27271 type:complete len:1191 (+) comp4410_c0_seq1:3-3575(+)